MLLLMIQVTTIALISPEHNPSTYQSQWINEYAVHCVRRFWPRWNGNNLVGLTCSNTDLIGNDKKCLRDWLREQDLNLRPFVAIKSKPEANRF